MNVLKFGFSHWKKYLPMAIVIQILSFCAITADLFIPLLSEILIDYVLYENEPTGEGVFAFLTDGRFGGVHTFRLFFAVAVTLLILLIIRLSIVYIKNVGNQWLGIGLETDLRKLTFDKLMRLDSAKISEYNTGELLTTINSDTIMFKELFCRMFPNIMDSIFVMAISIVLLVNIHPWFLFIPVLLAPFFTVALLRFRKQAKANYQRIRGNNSVMNLTVQENIEAVRLVRSFTNEKVEEEKFDVANENLRESHIRQIRLSSKFEVVFSTIKQIAYIGSIAAAAILVMRGELLVGFLVTCSQYVLKIMDHISQINNTLFQMQQQIVSGQKMLNFMDCPIAVESGEEQIEEHAKVNLSLSHISLELGGNAVLKDISLDIPYGKKVGIVGGTGSGKSVLLESLSRIYDVTEGEITLNGKNIKSYDLEALRDCFAYVFQDVFLFSDTIDSNIAYSEPKIAHDQIVAAAKHAQAHGFIKGLPDSYETIVGERGLGISGGQKQRVAIARALLKNAQILVLDDSTSALDVNTERRLLEEIEKYYKHRTVIISAHRLSSVVNCDEILYMQDGIVAERGTFDELMKLNGHFAKVYNMQKAQRSETVNYDELGVTV